MMSRYEVCPPEVTPHTGPLIVCTCVPGEQADGDEPVWARDPGANCHPANAATAAIVTSASTTLARLAPKPVMADLPSGFEALLGCIYPPRRR